MQDINKASRAENQEVGSDSMPGAIPTGAAPPVPTWMITGWRQVAGLDSTVARDAKTQEEMGILADYLSEQTYGHWFHNAGIVSPLSLSAIARWLS